MDTLFSSFTRTATRTVRWLGILAVWLALSIPLLAALWPLLPIAAAAAASTLAAGTWLTSYRSAS